MLFLKKGKKASCRYFPGRKGVGVMNQPFTIYLINGTHWDREWYQNFQGFRWRLVSMMDDALEQLKGHPDFPVFNLDGQTIPLKDYLEIAPEKEPEIREMIRKGRLVIGPWYVMPDEFLLSGESLIQNLLIGRRICKEFDADPSPVGYICDIFGHAAQTPQIFAGFGFSGAVLGRGTNRQALPSFFLWQSPDGTQCPTFRLDDVGGYGSYTMRVMNALTPDTTPEQLDSLIRQFVDVEIERSNIPVVVLMDALDHEHLHPQLLEHQQRIQAMYPQAQVKIVSLEDVFRQANGYIDKMPIKEGELNLTSKELNPYLHLISHVLSSRYDLKKANDQCQTLMEKWVQPFTALSLLAGNPLRRGYQELAYQSLIQNHPHDSICGCSQDQVHKDMQYRFDQVFEISREVREYGIKALQPPKERASCQERMLLTIANPLPYKRKEAVTADLWFDPAYPHRYSEPFGYEDRNSFRILNCKGQEVPYKLLEVQRQQTIVQAGKSMVADRHTVAFEAELAPGGLTEYCVVPCETPVRFFDSLRTGPYQAENALVRLALSSDGSVTLTDKRTGSAYSQLLTLEDNGEIGDGWFHADPTNDRIILSAGAPSILELVEDGPARCTFRITKELKVPAKLERVKGLNPNFHRSQQWAGITVCMDLSVERESPMIKVSMTVSNQAENHRLKLLLPTGIEDGRYFASEPFCVVDRACGQSLETQDWREVDSLEKAMSAFAGKRDQAGQGLAVVSAYGLHEVAGLEGPSGTLAVTLLRSFGQCAPAQQCIDGQMLGSYSYCFGLLPLASNTSWGEIQRYQDCLAAGIETRTDWTAENCEGSHSFFALEGDPSLCFSTLKLPEEGEGLVVRVYNLSDRSASGTLMFDRPVKRAQLTNLKEQPLSDLIAERCQVKLELAPWKIGTVLVQL